MVSLSHSHGSFLLTLFFLSPFLLITLSDSLILSSVKPLFDSHVPLFSLSWSLRRCGSVGKQSWWVSVWIGVGSCGLWAATSWVLVWVGEVGLLWFEQRLCGSQDPNLAELAVIGMGFLKKIVDLGLVLLWVLVLLLNVFDLGMFEVWCWMVVCLGWSVFDCLIGRLLSLASLSLTHSFWREKESKQKGVRGLRLTVLESVWT